MGRALAGAVLALLLAGCATLGSGTAGDARWPADVPASARLTGVPFFPQQEYQCGPAALATTLSYAGVDINPQALLSQVYTPALQGSLQLDLIGATRRNGRMPYRIAPTEQALLQEVSAGNPVLVLQDVGRLGVAWHYAVVVGYDRQADALLLHSGPERHLSMSLQDFDRSWARGGRWGLVTLPPERIPASAEERDYLTQVAAVEPVRPALAQAAYRASLRHWPGSLGALMGLGNLAYGEGQLEEAAGYFRDAVQAHPDAGDAFNNLAQTESRLGRTAEAHAAIARALALGGPHAALYRKTREAMDAVP